ncbi:tRNA (5-methylaminomethyl-2-thiouridine)(34)-methyltransferase MnmD [Amaricoccus tamworthensis]|uniref:tRNA (5-methylaminomethyl-2-thiouridine)(34)-methyltransferase MnmD n=1 Tax=Amaricoccus tamworthensis TaxID=57002 RepID=UPI003C79B26F
MSASRTQKADLDWRDGLVPVSRQFQDPYFSLADGMAESRHVFLAGNRLPERLTDGFHVAELGFGTGLNAMLLAQAWAGENRPGRISYTGFEAFPMNPDDMAQAHRAWPNLAGLSESLIAEWRAGTKQFALGGVDVTLVFGDARQTVPAWDGVADAWFLDGFSPAKNPELWEPDLLRAVGEHTKSGGTFATYSAAGHVRSSLADGGFEVERTNGFGRKRHMTIGIKY